MAYTYILIDLGLLIFSGLLFSLKELNFAKDSKFLILSVLINVFVFSVPTEFLTQLKVIVFNPPYLTGLTLWELPAEELMLYFLLPGAGLAVYSYLNVRYPENKLEKYSLAVSNIMLGVCIAMLYFGHQKLYTVFTFALLLAFLVFIEYVGKIRFMFKFYRAYVVSLILFYIVFGVLTSVPVMQYNSSETLNFNLFHIPFESHFYFMAMLLLSTYLFELFKSRAAR